MIIDNSAEKTVVIALQPWNTKSIISALQHTDKWITIVNDPWRLQSHDNPFSMLKLRKQQQKPYSLDLIKLMNSLHRKTNRRSRKGRTKKKIYFVFNFKWGTQNTWRNWISKVINASEWISAYMRSRTDQKDHKTEVCIWTHWDINRPHKYLFSRWIAYRVIDLSNSFSTVLTISATITLSNGHTIQLSILRYLQWNPV